MACRSLTPRVALKLLHKGKIKGRKIKPKQRRFLGWLSGGKKGWKKK